MGFGKSATARHATARAMAAHATARETAAREMVVRATARATYMSSSRVDGPPLAHPRRWFS